MTKEEEQYFHDTYQRFYPALLQYCVIKLNGNQSLGLEICQDTFPVFMDAPRDFPNDDAIRAFLFRTARNLVARLYQKQARERARITYFEDMPPNFEYERLSYQMDLEYWLGLQVPIGEKKEEILSALSHDERELYVWYFVEHQSPEAIAARLGIRPNAVHQRLHRLRKEIKMHVKRLKLL